MRNISSLFISFALLIAICASPAFSSTNTFSVSGTVLDGFCEPLPGANVTLIDTNSKVLQTTSTDSNGHFDFMNITANTDAIAVRTSYRHHNTTYEVPAERIQWYRASGNVYIGPDQTQLNDYVPLQAGYIRGYIARHDDPSKKVNGTIFVSNIAHMSSPDGTFVFYIPPGTYDVYAIHNEFGASYVSNTVQVTVDDSAASISDAPVTVLTVKIPNPGLMALSLLLGIISVAGMYLMLKKL